MRTIALLIAGATLVGCTTATSQPDSAAAQQRLDQLLAGKVVGPPVDCIPAYLKNTGTVITPRALAFEASGRVYVSSTAGSGCEGVSGQNYSLVTTTHGPSGLCAGDIAQLRDLQTGVTAGSCSLSPFVPYSRPQ
ncbi:hypothetical protein ACUXST_001340 [Sphingomonas sp. F9_3S_D5_B_2]